jgi:PAS domain S-box-containing protein
MVHEAFNDLVDLDGLKSLMTLFHQAMGLPMGIVDPEGEILLSTEAREFCPCFRLCGSRAPDRCRKNEASIQARLGGGDYVEYRCDSGLWDVAVPILVEGCHLATLFLGPFFYEDDSPDLDRFCHSSQELGVDPEGCRDRVSRIPIFSRERIRQIMAYYTHFVDMLSRQSLDRLKLIEEIGDRIQSEIELANHNRLLSTLIESIPSPIFYKDRQRRFMGCNRAFADLVGRNKKRILGSTLDEIHPTRSQSWLEQCKVNDKRLLEQPGIHVEDDAFVGEDGKECYHTVTLSTFRDAKGEVAGIVGFIQDLSDRKRIEDDLREVQSIYQKVIANAQGIPYRLHDRSHTYEVFGPGFEALFGMPPEQLTRGKLRSLIQECIVLNDTWTSPEEYKGLFRSRSVERYRADIRIITPEGEEKWLNDCSLPVYDKETGEYTVRWEFSRTLPTGRRWKKLCETAKSGFANWRNCFRKWFSKWMRKATRVF